MQFPDVRTLDRLAQLPRVAYIDNGKGIYGNSPVIAVTRGEAGYTPVYTHHSAEHLNNAEGVTPAQAAAMHAGSMFGWSVPAADPARYTAEGDLIRQGFGS